jgi:hypothetical protein
MESGDGVVLAALGIVATLATALVWLLKMQFKQNATTLRENTVATTKLATTLDGFKRTLDAEDKNREQFQTHVITVLKKISDKQDDIHHTVEIVNSEVDILIKGK